jgi:hypothetical protein
VIGSILRQFVVQNGLGIVAWEAGTLRLMPGLVRIPDISSIRFDRLPGRRIPREPIPDLVPDLAVEILSTSNTPKEMADTLRDYFRTGVRLVWYVDPVACAWWKSSRPLIDRRDLAKIRCSMVAWCCQVSHCRFAKSSPNPKPPPRSRRGFPVLEERLARSRPSASGRFRIGPTSVGPTRCLGKIADFDRAGATQR